MAHAKINLALHLRGRRADGYHLIESLVAFTALGDTVAAVPSHELTLSVSGHFAENVPHGPDNLIVRAARLLAARRGAAVSLVKDLPVAAGLGGGSADAAAAMRLLSRLWEVPLPRLSDTAELGADLPVCVNSVAARVEGIGEFVTELPPLPPLSVLLVNPGAMLSTAEVYAAASHPDMPPLPPLPSFREARELAAWLQLQRNDLEDPALRLCPVVADVLATLRAGSDCLLARMSGSGSTCFGLFTTPAHAAREAERIVASNPSWWVRSTDLIE